MKKILTNKNTYIILSALILSAVSIKLITVDSKSKVYISKDKIYSYEMLSQKINSVERVTAKNEESVLPSGTPSQTKANPLNQSPYRRGVQKTNHTNASFRNQPSPEVLSVLSLGQNASPSKQGITQGKKITASLTAKSIGNYQSKTNVSVSNASLNNGAQKAKPNGPGMEGNLPIGDGIWLLALFAIVYGVNKYHLSK